MWVLTVLELVGASVGGMLDDIEGLAAGWLLVVLLEIVVYGPMVLRTYRGKLEPGPRRVVAVGERQRRRPLGVALHPLVEDHVEAALLADQPGGHPAHDATVLDVAVDHGVRADRHVVADRDRPEQLRTRSDVDPVPDRRRPLARPRCA